MASGFIYIRDTEKVSVTMGGTTTIVNKLKLPFGIHETTLPKIPVIDVGTYYDTVDNPINVPTPVSLGPYDAENGSYDATIKSTDFSVIFTPINEEETEFGMILMIK